jgi:Dolichyl-phosphate-mannose-protein mannosyltransferase
VPDSRKMQALLVVVTTAALAPFLNKAFHIDDPLFLWMAQQIGKHPLDPYGFEVNWVSFTQPMSVVMQNPPLCCYYIAAVAAVFGWSEPALHLAFLFWPIISILGTFAVARRFCHEPLMAALLTLFTPAFLPSSTSIMCDVTMLAFWIWALEFWLKGLDRSRWWHFLVSAVLISLAALTKYFALALVPLLAVYTFARARRLIPQLAWLLIPIVVISNYDLVADEKYGHGLFSAATTVSAAISSATKPSHFVQLLMGLAFAGGCFASALFFAPLRKGRWALLAAVGLVLFAAGFRFLIVSRFYLETDAAPVWLEGGIFATIGAGILALTVINLVQQRNADGLLLFLWILGTFLFATFFNWSVTARTFLPLGPAVAILIVRYLERRRRISGLRYLPLTAAAGLSILITIADYQLANCARRAARIYRDRYGAEANNVRFLGHWGFQYYMQQWGAQAMDRKLGNIARGNIIVGPFSDTNRIELSAEETVARDESSCSVLPFVSTLGIGTGAGFYTSLYGPLPWAINRVPPERYYTVQTR